MHKGASSHHMSFQNLTLLPFPTVEAMLLPITSHSPLMAFHKPTSNLSLTSLELHPPSSS